MVESAMKNILILLFCAGGAFLLVAMSIYSIMLARKAAKAQSAIMVKADEQIAIGREARQIAKEAHELTKQSVLLREDTNRLLGVITEGTKLDE